MHSTLKSVDNIIKSKSGEGLQSMGLSFFSVAEIKPSD